MPRNCNCAGPCGPDSNGVTRREFLTLVGAGTAAALLGGPTWGRFVEKAANPAELAEWKRALFAPSETRIYTSDKHTDARMHLGGIGTGNFEIGADGRFTNWQLFNTLRDGYVPFFFGVKAGKTAKLLQTTGGPDLPRIKQIEMTGEYPFATLKYLDPDLPVNLEMTAFSPFAPLDTRLSSMPATCFVFKVHNPTKTKQTVSLCAMMQNPIGYDAMGAPEKGERLSNEHPNFGGNVNEVHQEKGLTTLLMRAEPGKEPTLDKPLTIYTNANPAGLNTPPLLRPANLTVHGLDVLTKAERPSPNPKEVIIWLEDPSTDITESHLLAARDIVKAGGTLVIAGKTMPLLQEYGRLTGGKPLGETRVNKDIVFEDFESGYGKWKVEGKAFGEKPAKGTLPNQQRVSGFLGKGLVNSYVEGDAATGKMTSRPFTVERSYIRFLVGGGSHPNTQIRLIVDGDIVRRMSGRDDEKLEPASWDVHDLKGKTAHIEIVDENSGGWGHINVDQIEFSDLPGSMSVMLLLEELLPFRFREVKSNEVNKSFVDFNGMNDPIPGMTSEILPILADERAPRNERDIPPTRFSRSLESGSVHLINSSLMDPSYAELFRPRNRAYHMLSLLAGVTVTPTFGVPPLAPGYGTVALTCYGQGAHATGTVSSWDDVLKLLGENPFDRKQLMPRLASPAGKSIDGNVQSTMKLDPGKTIEIPFFLAWHYPNKYNQAGTHIGNHYCAEWPDAMAVVTELARDFKQIREKTERFRKTFYDSTLPYWLLDCITSQVSTIRHIGVIFRTANGDAYGWEGSNGCCQPTCTHVWGYEQSLARLFPDLEKDMRRIDFKHQQRPDGGINNRTDFPSPPHPTGEQPFTDGHASCILKAYREALNHPDDSWLKEYWPNIKRAVEYLINRDTGGEFGEGMIADEQWNTYDDAIHGVNSFTGSYYLAALRAGEEMSQRMGDKEFANRCRTIWDRGKDNLVKQCFNGEYFYQDLKDYMQRAGEYGPGCLSDQLIGQWWAHQLGLGYVVPKKQVQTAMKSVFKYNWLADFSNFNHNWRKFAGGKDKGLLICTWPKGGRPKDTIPYVDEVWTGVEYQVAAHMIYEGMIEEAFSIIKGARDRYDGMPRPPLDRSPWNEIECGGHYARAMSSWSILLALSGFEYDGPNQYLRFTPRHTPENFKSFFTGPEGWGSLKQSRSGNSQKNEVQVVHGKLAVSSVRVDPGRRVGTVKMSVGRAQVPVKLKASMDGYLVQLTNPVILKQGDKLVINLA